MRTKLTPSSAISKELALEMRTAYKCLENMWFVTSDGTTETIEAIAISPYDILNKWFFFNFYLECRDASKAIEFYNHSQYTVIGIVRQHILDGHVKYYYKNLEELTPLLRKNNQMKQSL